MVVRAPIATEPRAAALPEAAELGLAKLWPVLCSKPVVCNVEASRVKADAFRAVAAALDAARSSPAHCARSPGSNSSSVVWRCLVVIELFGLGSVIWYG